MGYGRVYVHVPSGFDYDRWIEGLRAGASFVTTGPMVRVHRNDSKIDVQIDADGPVESIEWIVNGHAELVTPTHHPAEALMARSIRRCIAKSSSIRRRG